MPECIGVADVVSYAGGACTIIGALNLDKRWGPPLVAFGRGLDCVDGPIARLLETASEDGAERDRRIDRVAEGSIVVGLMQQKIISPTMAGVGYGIRASANIDNDNPPSLGVSAMYLKDVALGLGLLATCLEPGETRQKYAKTVVKVLGWGAIVLGAKAAHEVS